VSGRHLVEEKRVLSVFLSVFFFYFCDKKSRELGRFDSKEHA